MGSEKTKDFLPTIRIRVTVEDPEKHIHIEHTISLTMFRHQLGGLKAQDEILDRVFHLMIYKLRQAVGWGLR